MSTKILSAALISSALLAAPVQAAGPAVSLSLSPQVRAGAGLDDESLLGGGAIGTLVSVAASLLGAYLLYDNILDGDDDEDLPESA